MMTRYLVRTAKDLKDDSVEGFNPFLSHKITIVMYDYVQNNIDKIIQINIHAAFNQYFKLVNLSKGNVYKNNKSQSASSVVDFKVGMASAVACQSKFPSLKIFKKQNITITDVIVDAWCNNSYNLREMILKCDSLVRRYVRQRAEEWAQGWKAFRRDWKR